MCAFQTQLLPLPAASAYYSLSIGGIHAFHASGCMGLICMALLVRSDVNIHTGVVPRAWLAPMIINSSDI